MRKEGKGQGKRGREGEGRKKRKEGRSMGEKEAAYVAVLGS